MRPLLRERRVSMSSLERNAPRRRDREPEPPQVEHVPAHQDERTAQDGHRSADDAEERHEDRGHGDRTSARPGVERGAGTEPSRRRQHGRQRRCPDLTPGRDREDGHADRRGDLRAARRTGYERATRSGEERPGLRS